MAAPSLKKLMTAWGESDDLLDDLFGEMAPALDKMRKDLAKAIEALPRNADGTIRDAPDDLLKEIEAQGTYLDALGGILPKVAGTTAPTLGEVGLEVPTVSRRAQMTFAKRAKAAVKDVFGSLNSGLSGLLAQASTSPIPADKLASMAAQLADQPLAQASTLANTALAGMQREVTAQAAEGLPGGADDALYLYLGPVDATTRPFCRKYAGKAMTGKELSKIKNGQKLAVKSYGGGYNCRHSIIPISRAYAEASDIEILGEPKTRPSEPPRLERPTPQRADVDLGAMNASTAEGQAERAKVADQPDGWRYHLASRLGESLQSLPLNDFVQKHAAIAQTVWDKHGLVISPGADGSLDLPLISKAIDELDTLNKAIDTRSLLAKHGIGLTARDEGKDNPAFFINGSYLPDSRQVALQRSQERGGIYTTLSHEIFHALDHAAGGLQDLRSRIDGELVDAEFIRSYRKDGPAQFRAYQDLPQEVLARLLEQTAAYASPEGMSSITSKQAGYWDLQFIDDHLEDIADIADEIGASFRPEHLDKIRYLAKKERRAKYRNRS